MERLKPCPFCGSEAEINGRDRLHYWFIQCVECGATQYGKETKEEAVDAWNRQALREAMYHEAFETDSDMQKWDSGCWIRYKMFENAIESAPTIDPVKHGKWIPCKKQMPKPNETVHWVRKHYLVQNEFGDMMVASYRGTGLWEQMYHFKPIEDEIVAWMELPEEYKERSEDGETTGNVRCRVQRSDDA